MTTARSVDADDALTALYLRHYTDLVGLVGLMLGDVAAAEEVAQDAYIAVKRAWHRIEDMDRAAAYLRSTALNLARTRMKRHKLHLTKVRAEPERHVASAEASALASAVADDVVAALRRLPARQREAVVLRYYADLTEPQIAEAMGLSVGAVKSHLHRGRAALAALLEEHR
jgi:RNA polymerase sigma-70 factor (sigma-E family)